MMQPNAIVEIGTLHAGTSEVFCRALWENGQGTLYTTDPYGAERCPAVIAKWPVPLRKVEFRPDNSMAFFEHLRGRGIVSDLVLIDGNHEFEHALFDLQLAAKLTRPEGVIIMDNAEQTGPFQAARQFLSFNPAWTELGTAVANFDANRPFAIENSSFPGTTFILLQSPTGFILNANTPTSWGQYFVEERQIDAFSIEFGPQIAEGSLHYRVYFRAFAQDNKFVTEDVRVGSIPLKLSDSDCFVTHRIEPIVPELPMRFADCRQTVEVELFWLPRSKASPYLLLKKLPRPL